MYGGVVEVPPELLLEVSGVSGSVQNVIIWTNLLASSDRATFRQTSTKYFETVGLHCSLQQNEEGF
jgi:hypothetical protein